MIEQVTILGSTGSIGVNTLDVIARNSEKYKVFALTANSNIDLLVEQCKTFEPSYAVIADAALSAALTTKLKQVGFNGEVLSGVDGLSHVAEHAEVDTVMAAIVGAAGLLPSLAAANAGKRILLANKEALVMAGPLFMKAVQDHKATLLPIDSEHNALFQCLPQQQGKTGVTKLVLTASGGPFRDTPCSELQNVTPAQACAHPNWEMGRKISVDSATMMNKTLEVIEAHYLFDMPADKIDVLLHPESIIHSMVEYVDGSVLAQMGNPDMRTPIAHALAYPDRISSGVERLNLMNQSLSFREVSLEQYPSLQLAYWALKQGGTAATIINAANEVAVAAFLDERLKFTEIFDVVEYVSKNQQVHNINTLSDVLTADKLAGQSAEQKIHERI